MSLSAKHWTERAEEARVQAEQMDDPVAKRTMLSIAAGYEQLAARAEERERAELNRGSQAGR
jgi:hypothetical protein